MKVPGQEEREELELIWMRGEFDPDGDGVVSGRRLERGEGRTAEQADGPQCDEWDDVFITLRGTPVVGSQEPFFAPRGSEAALANRMETKWLIELSNPLLSPYWAKALRAMSRGDVCRFMCAAKKSKEWLQSLADCCEPIEGMATDGKKTAVAIPPGRVQVDVQGRQQVVDVRLDGWLKCADVSKRSGPKLYKRVLELPSAVVAESKLSKEDQLLEQLRHVGDFERSQPENEDAEEKAKRDMETAGGRQRRAPRAPDRVRVQYALRVKAGERTGRYHEVASSSIGGLLDAPLEFNLGGRLKQGGYKPWPVLEECIGHMEEGERASFTFVAENDGRLPLNGTPASALSEGDYYAATNE